jgi:hypothetical protein
MVSSLCAILIDEGLVEIGVRFDRFKQDPLVTTSAPLEQHATVITEWHLPTAKQCLATL